MTLTQVGVMIGTPRYMSPEQCDGVQLTPASDVYSLGIILYEMLAGMTPFTGSTPLAVAMKHSSSPPRPPSEIVATIPPAIESVVLHALEKNPSDRPANADEFRHELYITAEQLGLEHSNILTAPSLETLRYAGTETASGRLVVDIERLRQHRATTSGSSDLTVLNSGARKAPPLPSVNAAQQPAPRIERDFPRVTVPVDGPAPGRRRKLGLLLGVFLLAMLVAGLVFVVSRPGGSAINSVNAVATPTPAPTPSPLATPSPTAVPAKPTPRPAKKEPPKKKQSKVGAAFSKLKRILKKPF